MVPDGARVASRFTTHGHHHHHHHHDARGGGGGASPFFQGDAPAFDEHRRMPRHATQAPPRRTRTEREPPARPRRASRPTPSESVPFRGRDYFKCPELDQRMKKYLVRLANETANHLIRDTLEPEHTSLVWKPMTTIKGIDILRGHERVQAATASGEHGQPADAARDSTCLRGVAQVNASIEEFAMLFKLDTNKQLAEHGLLFNPDLLDMTTLYSLVQPSGDHPRRYVGIKWCLVQSPSRIFRNRDFCYLECQKEFRDANGRRGWVRSMHSIKMPCCQTLEKSHGIVRASLYRCGLIAVETDKPGVLDTMYTIEMDLKGHFPEIFQPKFLSQRIAALASIDKYLQQQRLSSSPLLGDLDMPATKAKGSCHFCFREFATFTKRYMCRKCGEGVCKHCSDDWLLDIPVIGSKKVRICTVCSAEARYCHSTPLSARDTFSAGYVMDEDGSIQQKQQQHLHPQVRRSNSLPGNYDFENQPHRPTAKSVFHTARSTPPHVMYDQDPVDDYSPKQRPRQDSRAQPRESDYASEFNDVYHGTGIRGTVNLAGLWSEDDEDQPGTPETAYQQRRGTAGGRLEARAVPAWRGTTASESGRSQASYNPSRASTVTPGRSVQHEHGVSQASQVQYGNNGHFPPSARYTVVGNRLERANSYDAGRHLEEQHHQQQQQTRQQPPERRQTVYHGNSRRSQQQLNDGYSPQRHRPSPSAQQRYNHDSASPRSQYSQQHQPQLQRQDSSSSHTTNGRHVNGHQQAPQVVPTPRNVALEFATQSRTAPLQSAPTPRNVALEFARQPQASQQPTAPRNIALEFARQPQTQHQTPVAPRNIALEFVKQQMQQPASEPSANPFVQAPRQKFGESAPKRFQAFEVEPEPSQSPVEYVETDSGEWIASDRWEKGVLNFSFLDVDPGHEPLETRFCGQCGAKQYIHEGVMEATCDCEVEEELTRPSTLGGQSSRDESRVSFRVEGSAFGSSPMYSDGGQSRLGSSYDSNLRMSIDDDPVIPLLVDRLSQQSLRSSFHHT